MAGAMAKTAKHINNNEMGGKNFTKDYFLNPNRCR
jgi:hypothetical protein